LGEGPRDQTERQWEASDEVRKRFQLGVGGRIQAGDGLPEECPAGFRWPVFEPEGRRGNPQVLGEGHGPRGDQGPRLAARNRNVRDIRFLGQVVHHQQDRLVVESTRQEARRLFGRGIDRFRPAETAGDAGQFRGKPGAINPD